MSACRRSSRQNQSFLPRHTGVFLLCLLLVELWHCSEITCDLAKDAQHTRVPKFTSPAACHYSALQQNLPRCGVPPARGYTLLTGSTRNTQEAGILHLVCDPQQTRLTFLHGGTNQHASDISFMPSASLGAPAACSLLQNVDLLYPSCRR